MTTTTQTIQDTHLWRDGSLCERTFVLDVRTPAEYRETHIPGSTNIPLADLRSRAAELEELCRTGRIAIVCRTGKRASEAARVLNDCCTRELHVLDGGIVSWIDSGLPVNRGEKAVSLERQVRITAGGMILLGVGLGILVHPALYGLSAFVGAGLLHSGITDTCAMGVLLARLPWNRAPSPAARS